MTSVSIADVGPIVRGVRGIVLPNHGNADHRSKSNQTYDIVTDLDVRVETHLRERLAERFPCVAFVGEETGGDRSAKTKWLCDPIDGTGHYVRGTPFCTTMLALVEDGIVTFSVIYDFIADILYHAVRGGGAFQDGVPIRVSDRPLDKSYLGWETHIQVPENLALHLALARRASFFKTICAGYEFVLVATGKIEGRLCFDPYGKDYDFAAGTLLVSEAGGVVANVGSRTYDYTNLNFLAANPVVFADLTEGPDALFPIHE